MDGTDIIICKDCGQAVPDFLLPHLREQHGCGIQEYLTRHPGAQISSARLEEQASKIKTPKRVAPDPLTAWHIKFGDLVFPVNLDVPEDDCLPLPDHYRFPKHGALGKDARLVTLALLKHRSMYIWGMPGTGKDATIHAWSYLTRTPAIIKQIHPGADLEAWFFSRGFTAAGTYWEEGEVLKALRDGYLTTSGRRIPYVMLFTDFDRADREQVEYLRLITDSIQGRVCGPAGRVYKVFPGTCIIATANTAGGGDERARMVSANPLDASILDRFERFVQYHWMSWEDELPILKAKFPVFFETFPNVELKLRDVTSALRKSVENGELYGEFSHRSLCHILSQATDLLAVNIEIPPNLLATATRIWVDSLPDQENRLAANRIMDPHLKTLAKDPDLKTPDPPF